MHKAVLVAAVLAALSAEALADSANSNSSSGSVSNSGSSSYGNVGNATTNYMAPTAGAASNASTASNSTSSNNGNTQVIQFITPQPTTAEVAAQRDAQAAVQATPTSSLLKQELTGGTDSTVTNRLEGESTQRVEYSGTQTIKNVPSVNGPPLITSNDTCMGSSSGSINGPGFGIGLGSTWTDRNCVLLKNAREMWNMGMKAAAMALMCTDANNRSALEITGFVCPQTAVARQAQADVDRQASVARENERLKARLSALEAEKAANAMPPQASTNASGRRSNPSAEAMLPPPVVPAVAEVPARDAGALRSTPALGAAPAVAIETKEVPVATENAQVEVTPIPDSKVEPTAQGDGAILIRVVSDPKQ